MKEKREEEEREEREEEREEEKDMVEITRDTLDTFSAQCYIGAIAALSLKEKGTVTLKVNSEGKVILCP